MNVFFLADVPPELQIQMPVVAKNRNFAIKQIKVGSVEKVRLFCDFVGNPQPHITWFLDDKRIPVDTETSVISTEYPFKVLMIDLEAARRIHGSLDAKMISGEYRARAVNDYGEAECLTFLELDTKLTIRKFLPQKAIEGHNLKMKCYVLGRNSVNVATIVWTKVDMKGNRYTLPSNHRHTIIERGRTLVIKELKKSEDDGTYECTASYDETTDKIKHSARQSMYLNVMRE